MSAGTLGTKDSVIQPQLAAPSFFSRSKDYATSFIPTPSSLRQRYANIQQFSTDFIRIVRPFIRSNAGDIAYVSAVNIMLPFISGAIVSHFATKSNNNEEIKSDEYAVFSFNAEAIMVALLPVLNVALRVSANRLLSRALKNAIKKEINKEYHGNTDLLDHVSKPKEPQQISSIVDRHVNTFADSAIPFTIGLLGNGLDVYFMYSTMDKLVGQKPALTSLGLSTVLGFAIIVTGKKLNNVLKIERTSGENISARLNYEQSNRAQISMLRGQNYEKEKILKEITLQENALYKIHLVDVMSCIVGLTAFIAYPEMLRTLNTSLKEKGVSQKEIDAYSGQALHVMATIRDSIGPFSSWGQAYESMGHIAYILNSADEINKFNFKSPLIRKYNSGNNNIEFKNFFYATQVYNDEEGKKIGLSEKVSKILSSKPETLTDLVLEPAIYKLAGKKGCGKSTLLKACFDQWPYAAGEINFPCTEREVYLMPQKGFTPHKSSLLEVVIYPRAVETISKDDQEKIIGYMQHLGFEASKIELLKNTQYKEDDWSTNLLSIGEQQCIAVIRMLMNEVKPKVLLMDEPTASVDPENTEKIQALVKEHMQGKTIIYVDHHDSVDHNISTSVEVHSFYDKVIEIERIAGKEALNLRVLTKAKFLAKNISDSEQSISASSSIVDTHSDSISIATTRQSDANNNWSGMVTARHRAAGAVRISLV